MGHVTLSITSLLNGFFSFVYGQNRKHKYGSVLWKKKSMGLITVEEYKAEQSLIIKRDNKTLSGLNLHTLEPTSRLYWYPHITELFPYVPRRILCLGGGACAYPIYAMHKNRQLVMDVVELDPVVVEAATKFFPLPSTDRFRLITDDGIRFLERTKPSTYDVIFVDVGLTMTALRSSFNTQFIHKKVLKKYHRILGAAGTLIINVITTRSPQDIHTVSKSLQPYTRLFASHLVFVVTPQADDSRLQDVVHVFSKQRILFAQLEKRLTMISSDRLSYRKDKYDYLLTTVRPSLLRI